MTPTHKKLIPYLEKILRAASAEDIETVKQEARLALQLAEQKK
jgi:hypothetical protein